MTILEKTSHISIIVLCCVAMGLLIEHRLTMSSEPESEVQRSRKSEIQLAGRALTIPNLQWRTAPVTLVFYISSTCVFCAQSSPFYERLVSARSSSQSPVRLVVVTADSPEVMQKYLAVSRFGADVVLSTDSGVAGLHLTPVIFAVDPSGVIKRVFIGKLDSSREKAVLSIVERGRV